MKSTKNIDMKNLSFDLGVDLKNIDLNVDLKNICSIDVKNSQIDLKGVDL